MFSWPLLLQSLTKRHKAAGEGNEETENLAVESTTLQCVPDVSEGQLEENKVPDHLNYLSKTSQVFPVILLSIIELH